MARTTEVSSKPHVSTARARPTLNPWIVIGLILILIAAFILLEMHIRRGVEGPRRLLQNAEFRIDEEQLVSFFDAFAFSAQRVDDFPDERAADPKPGQHFSVLLQNVIAYQPDECPLPPSKWRETLPPGLSLLGLRSAKPSVSTYALPVPPRHSKLLPYYFGVILRRRWLTTPPTIS